MEHDLGLLAFGERDQLGGTDVEVVDREGVAAGAPGLGEVRELAGEKVVDDVDAVPFGEQAIDEVRPDEPASAGDQGAHQAGSGTRVWESDSPGATTYPSPDDRTVECGACADDALGCR